MCGLWIHWIRKTDPHLQKELEELYVTYYQLFVKCAYDILGSVTEAEEVVQESISHFLRSRGIYRLYGLERESRIYYMKKAVRNRALSVYKKKRPWIPIEEVSSLLLIESPEEAYMEKVGIQLIQDAIMELPERERSVLLMHLHYPDMTYSQMATVLNISRKTIARRLYRAQKILARELKKRGFLLR